MDSKSNQRVLTLLLTSAFVIAGYWGLQTRSFLGVLGFPGVLPGLFIDFIVEGSHGGHGGMMLWMIASVFNFIIYYAVFSIFFLILSRVRNKGLRKRADTQHD